MQDATDEGRRAKRSKGPEEKKAGIYRRVETVEEGWVRGDEGEDAFRVNRSLPWALSYTSDFRQRRE